MSNELMVDVDTLRSQVREKYRDVANDPQGAHHFHTGRPLTARLGYDQHVVEGFPDRAVESFAGVGNPAALEIEETRNFCFVIFLYGDVSEFQIHRNSLASENHPRGQ